ncbi:MAG: SNF2-related protein [Nitrospirota bacterium]
MNKHPFGRTWWGKAWVTAMENIDYNTNRLPRGRRYAKNGSVKTIDIHNGIVSAKVQGSRPKPYDIRINLKGFNTSQIKQIKETISSNPAIASDLTLGRLSESLLPLLNEKKIYILPKNWEDISADCSCPDWANPCKHLAAVYYIIANEIDKNPFLLFNLRGISAESLTEAAGFVAAHKDEDKKQAVDVFIQLDKINLSEIYSDLSHQAPFSESDIPDLAFTPIDIESIFLLLPDNPLFYTSGNFKSILHSAYKSIMIRSTYLDIHESNDLSFKNADYYLVHKKDIASFFVKQPNLIPHSLKAKHVSFKIPSLSDRKIDFKKEKGSEYSLKDILNLFLNIPLDIDPRRNSPSSVFLNALTSVALAFMRSASFIPEVAMHCDGEFTIRYVPIIYDEKTNKAVDYLRSIMPLNISFRQSDNSIMKKDGVHDLISMTITAFVYKFMESIEGFDYDKLYSAFFRGINYRPERFEERQTAKSVSDWLERLSIRNKEITPVIKMEIQKGDKFTVNIDVENRKEPLLPVIPLAKVFNSKGRILGYPAEIVRTDVSRQISIAADYMPKLRNILNNRGKEGIVITTDEMADFMTNASQILNILGIRSAIPKELKKLASPQTVLKAEMKGKGGALSYLSLGSMLDFSWEVAIGDKTVSKEEFVKLARSARGIVRFRDHYILLKPEEISNILDRLNKPVPNLSSAEVIHSAFTGKFEGTVFSPDEAIKGILDNIIKIEDINLPKKLKAILRPYQERGFKWLYSNTIKGFGSLIADDMGLGKTVQVITLILKLKEDKRLAQPAIVICPTTLVGNWEKECERFAPSLKVHIYHGTERNLTIKNQDIIITTYGVLRKDIEKFKEKSWALVVIDESQNIKNPETEQSRAVKLLKGTACIAMSGTPVENRLTELWSVFDFTNRGYLGQIGRFHRQYAVPIEKYRDREQIEKLRRATAPFLLRRLKTDKSVISDLPDKIIFDGYCYLSKEQTVLYQQVVDTTMKEIEKSEGIERRGLIFKLITSLKQICNHPAHYSKKGEPLRALSGKAEKTIDILDKILVGGEKAIIFTQYKEMGELLVQMIKRENRQDAFFFHGGLQRTKRDRMVSDFQNDNSHRLMIISLKAGGTGLNLTQR